MSRFNDVLNKKAVALSYDENKNAAPIIVASGMGYIAEKMVEVARESGVPVYEDNSLATMLTQLNLGAEIPTELYQAIIDIYIYFLKITKKRLPERQKKERAPKQRRQKMYRKRRKPNRRQKNLLPRKRKGRRKGFRH